MIWLKIIHMDIGPKSNNQESGLFVVSNGFWRAYIFVDTVVNVVYKIVVLRDHVYKPILRK